MINANRFSPSHTLLSANKAGDSHTDTIPDENQSTPVTLEQAKTVGTRLSWGATRSHENQGRHAIQHIFTVKGSPFFQDRKTSKEALQWPCAAVSESNLSSSSSSSESSLSGEDESIDIDKIKMKFNFGNVGEIMHKAVESGHGKIPLQGGTTEKHAVNEQKAVNPFGDGHQLLTMPRRKTACFGGRRVRFDAPNDQKDKQADIEKNPGEEKGLVFDLNRNRIFFVRSLIHSSGAYDRRNQDGPYKGYVHLDTMHTVAQAAFALREVSSKVKTRISNLEEFATFMLADSECRAILNYLREFVFAPRNKDAFLSDLDAHDEEEQQLRAFLQTAFENAEKHASLPPKKMLEKLENEQSLFLHESSSHIA
jgi:hypothetical protein